MYLSHIIFMITSKSGSSFLVETLLLLLPLLVSLGRFEHLHNQIIVLRWIFGGCYAVDTGYPYISIGESDAVY